MALAYTPIDNQTNTSGATRTNTAASGVPLGALIVGIVMDNGNALPGGSIADAGGNSYTLQAGANLNNVQANGFCEIFSAPVTTALTSGQIITYTKPVSGSAARLITGYVTGQDTTTPVDTAATASNFGNSQPVSTPSGTPAQSAPMYVGAAYGPGGGTATQAAGFTAINASSAAPTSVSGYIIGTGTTPQNYNPSWTGSRIWGSVILVINPASSGTIYNVSVAETMTLSDAAVAILATNDNVAESITLVTAQSNIATLPSAISESAPASTTESNQAVLPSTIAESAPATTTQGSTAILPSAAADTITLADAPASTAIYPSTVGDSLTLVDQDSTGGATYPAAVAESITLTDAFSAQVNGGATVAESAPATDSRTAAITLNLSVAESASLSDQVAAQLAAFVAVQEAASAQDQTAAGLIAQIAIQEALAFQDAYAQTGTVLVASKCNTLLGAPRMRGLVGSPRVRTLHGGCC
jgi:hypothetical protein